MKDESVFEKALQATLKHEGGYVNDPADPGGETKFGISKRSYPEVDIKHLSIEQAAAIYRRDYWDYLGLDLIDHGPLAAKIFDLAVNMGCRRAVLLLQEAVSTLRIAAGAFGVIIDGKMGSETRAAVNAYRHPAALLACLKVMAGNHYIELAHRGSGKYLAGWLARLEG